MAPTAQAKRKDNDREVMLFVAYYMVLAAFFVASLFPEARFWGINWWAYLPLVARLSLLLLGIAAPIALSYLSRRPRSSGSPDGAADRKSGGYFVPIVVIIALFGSAFVMFRGTTHFLGDGYQLLARLADRAPSVKAWAKGAYIISDGLFTLLSGAPADRALFTYQLISIGSGMGFLVGVALLSRALFESNVKRYLFVLGLASSGYILLFFGYVEDYAPLIATMMLYVLVGLLVVRGKASRWWLLPPLVAALFLHLFAAVLLPSVAYLLLRDSRLGQGLAGLSNKAEYSLAAALAVLAFLIYYYLRADYYFFTFALLPAVPDRFTVEHDTLFSLKHIVDVANLLMLLVPGLPVFAAMLFVSPVKGWLTRPEYRFLLVAALSALAAVYVFNPGIGMPRNWDLFSIAGVPLAVLCFYYALEGRRSVRVLLLRAVPPIILGFLLLIPRVATQVVPDLGLAHFRNYLVLDKIRNRNAQVLLVEYYEKAGDMAAAQQERERREHGFPEIAIHGKGVELMRQARYSEAIDYLRRALDLNPLYYNVYGNLGACYLYQGNLDSALVLLKIADGVNPYNASIINNIGTAYLRKGEFEHAEKYFLKSLHIDSVEQNAMVGLASVYLQLNRLDRSLDYVSRIYRLTDMSYDYFRQAADAYLEKSAFDQAARAYDYAIRRGLDSAYVKELETRIPQLKR